MSEWTTLAVKKDTRDRLRILAATKHMKYGELLDEILKREGI